MDKAQLEKTLSLYGVDVSSLHLLFAPDGEQIYSLLVPGGDEATALWRRLRELVGQTAHWPVIFGNKDDVHMHGDCIEDFNANTTVREILHKAMEIDVSALLAGRLADNAPWRDADYQEYMQLSAELTAKGVGRERQVQELDELEARQDSVPRDQAEAIVAALDAWTGDWPSDADIPASSHLDDPFVSYVGSKLDPDGSAPLFYLGLVPTPLSWQVPAFLKIGNWNEYPQVQEHVALHKYWHEKYGAEVVTITHDIIEMQVARPPLDREGALHLATEQFSYCADIVAQGTNTISELAAGLLGANVWFFWWD